MDICKIVEGLIKDVIEDNNYILDSVSYVFEDGNNFLRVVIDKNGIIDIQSIEEKQVASIAITDYGIGMTEEQLDLFLAKITE